jgi:two-component system sensor histidine kinase AlgZ
MNHQQRAMEPSITQTEPLDDFFIPDLCRVQAVFLLILLTELVCFLFTLTRPISQGFDWFYLGLFSFFGLWIVLSCAASLCLLRKRLSQLPTPAAASIAYAIILLIVAVYSAVAAFFFRFEQEFQAGPFFFLRNLAIAAIIGGMVLRYFYLEHQRRAQKQAELRARLESLQSRIRPHFLFNSLNSIVSLIASNPQKAEDALLDLSELFRATLNTEQLLIPLTEELDMCRRYLNIEQLRLGDRLRQNWNIRVNNAGLRIPPLTLQPLAENAIYHGIQPLQEGGTITLEAYEKGEFVYILISNPIPEAGAEPCDTKQRNTKEDEQVHQGNKMAYKNIEHRIMAIFGHRAVLKTSIAAGLYTVTLRIPARQEFIDRPVAR